ncbi:MAG: hypothetical protein V3R85_10060, partial [Alphaproteobacteria bacterium]
MRITTLLSATAIALAATVGTVSAADQFATIDSVTATPMSSSELAAVAGQHVHFKIITTQGEVEPGVADADGHPLRGDFFRIGDPNKCTGRGCDDAPGIAGLLHADAIAGNPIVVFCGRDA